MLIPPDFANLKARLMANENPYGPSPMARDAIVKGVIHGNRYPFMHIGKLTNMLIEKEGVKQDQILLGPGSSDLLDKTALVTFKEKGGNVVSADPAYLALTDMAKSCGASWKNIKLAKDWSHDLTAMEEAVDDETRLVYICNPNNPTGSITSSSDLREFCKRVSQKTLVFVDEAYLDFLDDPVGESMVDLVKEGYNVIVARTFSKIHGMAGLRVGYILGQPAILEKVQTQGWSMMSMSAVSVLGAIASLQDTDFQNKCRAQIREDRDWTIAELAKLEYECIPSYTNFFMAPLRMRTKIYQQKMFSEGVGIRVFDIDRQPWTRVSVGTREEMEMFLDAFKKTVG